MSTTNYIDAVRDMANNKVPTKPYKGMSKEQKDMFKEEKKALKEAAKVLKDSQKATEKRKKQRTRELAKAEKEAAKEDAKRAKIEAKELAKAEKAQAKEDIKIAKALAKEDAKAEKAQAKLKAKAEREEAKEATRALKHFQKNALKAVKRQEAETKKKAKKLEQENLKLQKSNLKKARHIIAMCAAHSINQGEQTTVASNHLFKKPVTVLDETEKLAVEKYVVKNTNKWKSWSTLILKEWNTTDNTYVPSMWKSHFDDILTVESVFEIATSHDENEYITTILNRYTSNDIVHENNY